MSVCTNLRLFLGTPPDESMIRGEMEYRKQNRAPNPKPGDKFSITGALLFSIVGLILGFKFFGMWNPVGLLACLTGGALVGIILGSQVGKLLMKYKNRTKGN